MNHNSEAFIRIIGRPVRQRLHDRHAPERRLIADEKPLILDVGGEVGQSIRRYKKLFPGATIHSFEPHPQTYSRLTATAARFSSVTVHNLAVADSASHRQLYISTARTGVNSLLPRPSSGRRYYPSDAELTDVITIPTTTLDRFCSEHDISTVHVLKIDVQGAELLVLQGAKGLLSTQAIAIVTTEVAFVSHYEGGVLFSELWGYLDHHGYSLYDLRDFAYGRNGQLRYANATFLNLSMRSAIDSQEEER